MKVIYRKSPSKRKKCVATIGVFDGIHLGHQFILDRLRRQAKEEKLASLVITFDTPPQLIFKKKSSRYNWQPKKYFLGYLTDFKQKINIMKSLNIDYLWFLRTNKALLGLEAKDFIKYICRSFEIKRLIIGEDFRFGYKGKGNIEYLTRLSLENNFKLTIIRKKHKNNKIISSSLIRDFIRKGKLKEVEPFLGRKFSLKGKVIKGKGVGSKINFPTANIYPFDYVIPQRGVYAAYVIFGKKIYLAAVNIGLRPTLKRPRKIALEVHIIGFKKNILGKTLKVVFLEKIREEKRFSSLEKLIQVIDCVFLLVISKYGIPSLKHAQRIV
jgi:riboflavin kinase/FMN adenylyltransferase